MDLSVFTNATFFVFQIWVNNSVVFWYSGMYVTKIIRINHDNVASRGAVGRTHIIVRFQTGNRRKHQFERKISWVSYMCWIDFHNGIWGCGFLCTLLITLYFVSILSLFYLYFVSIFPATTPRAITSLPYHHGLSRLCIHPGYHTRAITLHQYTYIGLSHPLLVIRIL